MKRLSLEDLQRIYLLREKGDGIREISRKLRRNPSTISRELRDNKPARFWEWDCWSRARYSWEQRKKRQSFARIKMRLKSSGTRKYVEEKLQESISPELISLRMKQEGREETVSYQAIYDWIHEECPGLKQYLVRKGRRGRRGGKRRRGRQEKIENKRSISERSKVINLRQRFGDWEGDTVVSSRSKPCVLAMRERKSRYIRFVKIDDRTADSGKNGFIQALYEIPSELCLSITLDNGPENAKHKDIEERLKLAVYFCHPYCSWERGSVENGNGFLRRYFPKGTDFRQVSRHQLAEVERKHNHRPMKCLNGFTPHEVFLEQVKKYQSFHKAA